MRLEVASQGERVVLNGVAKFQTETLPERVKFWLWGWLGYHSVNR